MSLFDDLRSGYARAVADMSNLPSDSSVYGMKGLFEMLKGIHSQSRPGDLMSFVDGIVKAYLKKSGGKVEDNIKKMYKETYLRDNAVCFLQQDLLGSPAADDLFHTHEQFESDENKSKPLSEKDPEPDKRDYQDYSGRLGGNHVDDAVINDSVQELCNKITGTWSGDPEQEMAEYYNYELDSGTPPDVTPYGRKVLRECIDELNAYNGFRIAGRTDEMKERRETVLEILEDLGRSKMKARFEDEKEKAAQYVNDVKAPAGPLSIAQAMNDINTAIAGGDDVPTVTTSPAYDVLRDFLTGPNGYNTLNGILPPADRSNAQNYILAQFEAGKDLHGKNTEVQTFINDIPGKVATQTINSANATTTAAATSRVQNAKNEAEGILSTGITNITQYTRLKAFCEEYERIRKKAADKRTPEEQSFFDELTDCYEEASDTAVLQIYKCLNITPGMKPLALIPTPPATIPVADWNELLSFYKLYKSLSDKGGALTSGEQEFVDDPIVKDRYNKTLEHIKAYNIVNSYPPPQP